MFVTFDEGKTYKVISDTYENFNNHMGVCVRDLLDPSLARWDLQRKDLRDQVWHRTRNAFEIVDDAEH